MNEFNYMKQYGVLPIRRDEGSFDLQLRCWVRFCKFAMQEARRSSGLDWKQRWKAVRSGFTSATWESCQLDRNDLQYYVKDLRMALHAYKVNGFYNPIIGNKIVLSDLLLAKGLPHPRVISYLIQGRLMEPGAGGRQATATVLEHTLERYPRQVLRPDWSGGGRGVFFISKEGGTLKLNRQEITLDDLCGILSTHDRYLATEFEQQAEYANLIYPKTTNTLRILTLWDHEAGEAFVAAVVHRFGTDRSGILDSFHSGHGGVCAGVNRETGELGKAVGRNTESQMVHLSRHPDSKEAIEGVFVPQFGECLEGVLKAAGEFPFCPLIGWDVVITEKGYSIIEANPLPSLTVTQAQYPMLRDERTRRVFQQMGLA